MATGGVRAGVFGMTGVRDPHLVQHADGTPYVRDGLAYLTMTCAGMGFFAQAHWGVFTLDLAAPERLTQVGHLFSRRDGLVLGDHAGQVVVDESTGRCLIATSSWGDFSPAVGVHVRQAAAGLDVLHGVHVLDTEPLAAADAAQRVGPGHDPDRRPLARGVRGEPVPASPSTSTPRWRPDPPAVRWGEGLEPVGADTSLDQAEGPILARVDGEWRVLASDGPARSTSPTTCRCGGWAALPAPYGTNIPHPQLLPLPAGSPLGTELMVTFDGTAWGEKVLGYGTHGDHVVMAR